MKSLISVLLAASVSWPSASVGLTPVVPECSVRGQQFSLFSDLGTEASLWINFSRENRDIMFLHHALEGAFIAKRVSHSDGLKVRYFVRTAFRAADSWEISLKEIRNIMRLYSNRVRATEFSTEIISCIEKLD